MPTEKQITAALQAWFNVDPAEFHWSVACGMAGDHVAIDEAEKAMTRALMAAADARLIEKIEAVESSVEETRQHIRRGARTGPTKRFSLNPEAKP